MSAFDPLRTLAFREVEQHLEHRRHLVRFARMGGRTFEQGYLEGWISVAGDEPLPAEPTQPLPNEPRDYTTGFFYGRGDALERYVPGPAPKPSRDRNNGSPHH